MTVRRTCATIQSQVSVIREQWDRTLTGTFSMQDQKDYRMGSRIDRERLRADHSRAAATLEVSQTNTKRQSETNRESKRRSHNLLFVRLVSPVDTRDALGRIVLTRVGPQVPRGIMQHVFSISISVEQR